MTNELPFAEHEKESSLVFDEAIMKGRRPTIPRGIGKSSLFPLPLLLLFLYSSFSFFLLLPHFFFVFHFLLSPLQRNIPSFNSFKSAGTRMLLPDLISQTFLQESPTFAQCLKNQLSDLLDVGEQTKVVKTGKGKEGESLSVCLN
jgi:hypothetical protein